jgi:hypothetical protein
VVRGACDVESGVATNISFAPVAGSASQSPSLFERSTASPAGL